MKKVEILYIRKTHSILQKNTGIATGVPCPRLPTPRPPASLLLSKTHRDDEERGRFHMIQRDIHTYMMMKKVHKDEYDIRDEMT